MKLDDAQKKALAYAARTGEFDPATLKLVADASGETATTDEAPVEGEVVVEEETVELSQEEKVAAQVKEMLASFAQENKTTAAKEKPADEVVEESEEGEDVADEAETPETTDTTSQPAPDLALENAKYKALLKHSLPEKYLMLLDGATAASIEEKAAFLAGELVATKKTKAVPVLPPHKSKPKTAAEEIKSLIADQVRENRKR